MSCLTPNQLTDQVCYYKTVRSYSLRMIQLVRGEYTLDLLNVIDTYCTNVVRSKVMRVTAGLFNNVREGLVMAVNNLLPTREHSMWAES